MTAAAVIHISHPTNLDLTICGLVRKKDRFVYIADDSRELMQLTASCKRCLRSFTRRWQLANDDDDRRARIYPSEGEEE